MRDYATISKRLRRYSENCVAYKLDADFANAVTDAADAIEELLTAVPQWISVEERMPHYLDHVLCVNKFGIQMVGYLTDYKECGFRCESGMDSCDYITHWMPLPAPPKEVE